VSGNKRTTFSDGTETIDDPEKSWSQTLTNANKSSSYWTLKTAPRDRRKTKGHSERVIRRWETKTVNGVEGDVTSNLKPYWMFDMRKETGCPADQKKYFLSKMCNFRTLVN
jgi:hypothetical protein